MSALEDGVWDGERLMGSELFAWFIHGLYMLQSVVHRGSFTTGREPRVVYPAGDKTVGSIDTLTAI